MCSSSLQHHVLLALLLTAYCELIIERTIGLEPDRLMFLNVSGCGSDFCADYGGELVTTSPICTCRCPRQTPTFHLQVLDCITHLTDCNDLQFSATADKILTFSVTKDLELRPKIPVQERQKSLPLSQTTTCDRYQTTAVEHEVQSVWVSVTSASLVLALDSSTNETYFKMSVPERNLTDVVSTMTGLLVRVKVSCIASSSQTRELCISAKFKGFQHVVFSRSSSAYKAQHSNPLVIAYTVGGVIIGALALAGIVALRYIFCQKGEPPIRLSRQLLVRRLDSGLDAASGKTQPTRKIVRSSQQQQNPVHALNANPEFVNGAHPKSQSSESDSGRGKSRPSSSPHESPIPAPQLAIIQNLSTSNTVSSSTDDLSQKGRRGNTKLFKSHHQQLSTVQASIQAIEAQRKTSATPQRDRKGRFNLRSLFSRRPARSETSDSHLSIDYEHFQITPAPLPKLFSETHINPSISFNAIGQFTNADLVDVDESTQSDFYHMVADVHQVEMFPNDLYQGSYMGSHITSANHKPQDSDNSNKPNVGGSKEMPLTAIDDLL